MSMQFWRGSGAVMWVPAVAGTAGPTLAELTAGTDVSPAVVAVEGFITQLNRIGQPILSEEVEVQIDGPQTFVDSSLTIVEDDGTGTDADAEARQDAMETLIDNATGYVLFSRNIKAAVLDTGDPVFLFPVRVGAANPVWTLDAEPERTKIDFVITAAPRKNVLVLAGGA